MFGTNRSRRGVRLAAAALVLLTWCAAPVAAQERSHEDDPFSGVPRMKVKALYLPRPRYTREAARRNASGTVGVRALVGEDGRVLRAEALSGHPLLRQPALEAARKARFERPVKDGVPTKAQVILMVNFEIR